jgi:tetratricopeptide (TPR) repeat protein
VYCPECGHDAGEAKFCPECGADLNAVRAARAGARPAPEAGSRSGSHAGPRTADRCLRTPDDRPRTADDRRSLLPVLLWAGVGLVVVAVVLIVLLVGVKSDTGGSGGAGGGVATPVAADTSGSYRQLVARANGLYDQAVAAAQINDMGAAQSYGKAAAAVYAAAWSKQPGDPGVGTDWAHMLFFAGDFQAAVARVDAVLKADPGFQKGWANKGDFLWDLAQMTQDQGQAAQYAAQAKTAYQRALRLGPATKAGMYAAAQLKALK